MEARGLCPPKRCQEIRGNALVTSQIKDFDRQWLGKNKRNRALQKKQSYYTEELPEFYAQ